MTCTGNEAQPSTDFAGYSYDASSVVCPMGYLLVDSHDTAPRGCAHNADGPAVNMALIDQIVDCAVLGAGWSATGNVASAQHFVACLDPAVSTTTCVPLIDASPRSVPIIGIRLLPILIICSARCME